MLVCATISAQDSLYVMVRLNEVLYFNPSGTEITDRFDYAGDFSMQVKNGEVLQLHLFDKEKYYRDVTMTFYDGAVLHEIHDSSTKLLTSDVTWGAFAFIVSKPRKTTIKIK